MTQSTDSAEICVGKSKPRVALEGCRREVPYVLSRCPRAAAVNQSVEWLTQCKTSLGKIGVSRLSLSQVVGRSAFHDQRIDLRVLSAAAQSSRVLRALRRVCVGCN